MKSRLATICSLVFTAMFLGSICNAQTGFSVFENSDFGPYSVGFRSLWELDNSRAYRTSFDQGQTYGESKSPRPILINVWYPAQQGDKKDRVQYGDIVSGVLAPDSPRLATFSKAMATYAAEIVASEIFGKAEDELSEPEADLLLKFRESPSHSYRNAKPVSDRFPIVVYHAGAGSSFDDNAAFCEWLASFGYVVVGSAYPKGNGKTLAIDAGDDSAKDISFLIEYAANEAQGNWQKVAIVGHSAGAQAALHYACSPTNLADTLVLLDTTIDYYGRTIAQMTWSRLVDRIRNEKEQLNMPMLVAAGSGASFQVIDEVTTSDRTLLTVPHLDHNDFISQGVFSNLLKTRQTYSDREEAKRAQLHFATIASTYRKTNRYVLNYLDAHLKGKKEDLVNANRTYSQFDREEPSLFVELVNEGNRGPQPFSLDTNRLPTPRQFMQLVANKPVEVIIDWIKRVRKTEAEFELLDNSMLVGSALFEMTQAGRAEEAKALYRFLAEDSKGGLGAIRFQGDWAVMRKRYSDARVFYESLLQIDPDNVKFQEKLKSLEEFEEK